MPTGVMCPANSLPAEHPCTSTVDFRLQCKRNGLVLCKKRLERGRFHRPRAANATAAWNGPALSGLLDGFDSGHRRPCVSIHT